MITKNTVEAIVIRLVALGHGGDIEWANSCCMPNDEIEFAREAVFVICNSGMKNTVAQRIFERVWYALTDGKSAGTVFGHKLKCRAIDRIYRGRVEYLAILKAAHGVEGDDGVLQFCESLPHIGPITKYHLAKNFGAQVAKPDVHLQRLADREGCTAQQLCERLAAETGRNVATVDVILWRACAIGLINSKTGAVSA